jgi:lambda repressor-like predicted transcriptional regulator
VSDGMQSPFRLEAGGLVVVIVPVQLRAQCAKRGWSLTQLAVRAGISYPTLKSCLSGRPVRPRTAWRLARALGEGTTPAELDHLVEAS